MADDRAFLAYDLFNEHGIKLEDSNKIGAGGQGNIHLTNVGHFGKVAVKMFNSKCDKYTEKELENIVKYTHHPNIVRIFALVENNMGYKKGYIMEYMENGSLHDAIHSRKSTGRHTETEIDGPFVYDYGNAHAFNWMSQAARALSYLHKRRVIHRDVKPLNMLLSENFTKLKLCDLGIAREYKTNLTMTQKIGSTCYSAPEVLQDAKTKYTTSSDIYGLAISMWEVFTRKSPFNEDGKYARPNLNSVENDFVRELLPKMWCGNPDERKTSLEIVGELLPFCEELPSCTTSTDITETLTEANILSVGVGDTYQHVPVGLFGRFARVPKEYLSEDIPDDYEIELIMEFHETNDRRIAKVVHIHDDGRRNVQDLWFDGKWHMAPRGNPERVTMISSNRFRWEFGTAVGRTFEDADWLIREDSLVQIVHYDVEHVLIYFKRI